MVQLEGPIVQSFYDTALMAWWTTLNPRPPLLYETPIYPDKLDRSEFKFGDDHPLIHKKGDLQAVAERTVQRLAASDTNGRITPLSQIGAESPAHSVRTSGSPPVSVGEARSVISQSTVASTSPTTVAPSIVNDNVLKKIVSHESPPLSSVLVEERPESPQVTAPVPAPDAAPAAARAVTATETVTTPTNFTPILVHQPQDPFPIALVNRTPRGRELQLLCGANC